MGGNNGIGLGNNLPPVVNYPGVGNPGVGNVGNVGGVQQGGAQPNVVPVGGKARADYLASLADRLGKGSESYKAAVRRLDESIAHARKLHADGKVYSAEQWEDHDVQRKIAAPNLANMDATLDTYNITLSEKTTTVFTGKSHYVNYTNSFFRDMYDTVVMGTTHENWFK